MADEGKLGKKGRVLVLAGIREGNVDSEDTSAVVMMVIEVMVIVVLIAPVIVVKVVLKSVLMKSLFSTKIFLGGWRKGSAEGGSR